MELEIEGDRESVPSTSQALQNQFSGMLNVPSAIVEPDRSEKNITPPIALPPAKSGRKQPSRTVRPNNVADTPAAAFDFRHDATKWGNPSQLWATATKTLWLLFIIETQANIKEMSTAVIAATFNKHFRQAGLMKVGNINRDLGIAKGKVR